MTRKRASAGIGRTGKIGNWANLDVLREHRTGIPELVLCDGKRKDHLKAIVDRILKVRGRAIVTRLGPGTEGMLRALAKARGADIEVNRHARLAILRTRRARRRMPVATIGHVAIVAAGTADHAVGEEARMVAKELGCDVEAVYDVGVAGLHRLVDHLHENVNKGVDVYIVVAGREGTLPTIVAGLVDAPVIGVPVSTGYGKGGRGEAALLTMLQSCTPVLVVNIDAGCIAGAVAAQIANRMAGARAGMGPVRGHTDSRGR